MECITPLVFRRFPDFAYFIIVPFPLLYVAFFSDVDDIGFVGSFEMDCQSNGSVVSYIFSSYVEGIVCVSFRFADVIPETIGDDSIVNY